MKAQLIKMKVSEEIVELAEKIRKYRTDTKLVKSLKIKKESLEKQIGELEKTIKILKLNTIEKNKLLEQIKELEEDKKKLKLHSGTVLTSTTIINNERFQLYRMTCFQYILPFFKHSDYTSTNLNDMSN